MTKAVVVLGAGASADFGVPILSRIFSDSQAISFVRSNERFWDDLHNTIWEPRGLTLASAHLGPTVEDILTMLRDWDNAHGRQPMLAPPPDLDRFRRSLYSVIQRAVYERKSSRGKHLNQLIKLLAVNCEQVTWASFNWDCLFEASFYYHSDLPWPYGLRNNPRLAVNLAGWSASTSKQLLLKLHGGVNWWMVDGRLTYFPWGGADNVSTIWKRYEEDPACTAYPVILEPSFYKYTDSAAFQALRGQWTVFFDRLIEADWILVIGYSMPDLDTYAREMLLVAFQLNPSATWLVIDPSDPICRRYGRILGSKSVRVYQETLASLNNNMESKLGEVLPNFKAPTA